MITYRWIPLRMKRVVSDNSCRENQNPIFSPVNRTVYEVMWKKYGTAGQPTVGNIIRRMRVACSVTKATNKHSEYLMFTIFSTATKVTRTRLNVTLYVHCVYCFVRWDFFYFCWNNLFSRYHAFLSSSSFFFFSCRYNPLWLYFHSPLSGFSLLVFEVSWSHTTTRHNR